MTNFATAASLHVGSVQLVMIVIQIQTALIGGTEAQNSIADDEDGRHNKEYCTWETFEAKCSLVDEVVVMNSAVYGRMRYGRCIERDYGYVGCQRDVLEMADQDCSGRRQCSIEIPYKVFDRHHPCPKDLTRYLSANYTCLKVFSPSRRDCKPGAVARVTGAPFTSQDGGLGSLSSSSQSTGFLASVSTGETGCGSTETAWLVDAGPGQTVVLTLYDFGPSRHSQHHSGLGNMPTGFNASGVSLSAPSSTSRNSGSHNIADVSQTGAAGTHHHTASYCHDVYGTIRERVTGRVSTICSLKGSMSTAWSTSSTSTSYASSANRIAEIYRATGTGLEIKLLPGTGDRTRYFLIKYEVLGCADIDLPSDRILVSREGNVSTVRCVTSDQTWRVVCDGTRWVDPNYDCQSVGGALVNTGKTATGVSFTQPGALIIMAAIAAAIGIVIFFIGLICFRRFHGQRRLNGRNGDGSDRRLPPPDLYGTSPRDHGQPMSGKLQQGSGVVVGLYETTSGQPVNGMTGLNQTVMSGWSSSGQRRHHRRQPRGAMTECGVIGEDKTRTGCGFDENDYESMDDDATDQTMVVAFDHSTAAPPAAAQIHRTAGIYPVRIPFMPDPGPTVGASARPEAETLFRPYTAGPPGSGFAPSSPSAIVAQMMSQHAVRPGVTTAVGYHTQQSLPVSIPKAPMYEP